MSYLHAPKIFCLIKTCAPISKNLYCSVELGTFSPVFNAQFQSNMASVKRILRSNPWKNYLYFNWNRSFICPTLHFAWLKLALWFRKTPKKNAELLTFPPPFNAQCQSNEYCAHICGKIINISTEIGHLYVQHYILHD